MTTMTLALGLNGDPNDQARGRADAYDEHTAGADLETLETRYEWMADPTSAYAADQLVSSGYIDGYLAYIQDVRAGQVYATLVAARDYAAWAARTDRKPVSR
ncbi:hypothetical protein [Streptomyces sp. Wb2n-11]|uniref:hypothetical protein n=1 Tax=Streptomyces sp. Wb2n-11 TaxID=1030533 RepID=UPI000AF2944A|nr:hypothetical protein [Streptomyces sp. Wb2n-11]